MYPLCGKYLRTRGSSRILIQVLPNTLTYLCAYLIVVLALCSWLSRVKGTFHGEMVAKSVVNLALSARTITPYMGSAG